MRAFALLLALALAPAALAEPLVCQGVGNGYACANAGASGTSASAGASVYQDEGATSQTLTLQGGHTGAPGDSWDVASGRACAGATCDDASLLLIHNATYTGAAVRSYLATAQGNGEVFLVVEKVGGRVSVGALLCAPTWGCLP